MRFCETSRDDPTSLPGEVVHDDEAVDSPQAAIIEAGRSTDSSSTMVNRNILYIPSGIVARIFGSRISLSSWISSGESFGAMVMTPPRGELKLIPGFDAGLAANAFRHCDFSFGFEGNGHGKRRKRRSLRHSSNSYKYGVKVTVLSAGLLPGDASGLGLVPTG